MNTLSDTLQIIKNRPIESESKFNSTDSVNSKLAESKFDKAFKNHLKPAQDDTPKTIDKKLMDTCVEMESIFVSKMLKEMRKTVHKSEWINGGFAEEIFEDMLYDKYALNISKESNMGIAKQMYEQLSRK